MKLVKKDIEDWIKPYATLVGNKATKFDEKLRNSDPIKYFLHTTIPNRFEAYAIALHSFWVNPKILLKDIKEGVDDEICEKDFERVSWEEFFKRKGLTFKLADVYKSPGEFYGKFNLLNNEVFPGEGMLDKQHIDSIIEIATGQYGDQEIEVFYVYLAFEYSDADWNSKLYEGKLSTLSHFIKNTGITLTPSLIYSKSKNWVVNTSLDLPFTTIGGERKFIESLVMRNQNEIFEIEYNMRK